MTNKIPSVWETLEFLWKNWNIVIFANLLVILAIILIVLAGAAISIPIVGILIAPLTILFIYCGFLISMTYSIQLAEYEDTTFSISKQTVVSIFKRMRDTWYSITRSIGILAIGILVFFSIYVAIVGVIVTTSGLNYKTQIITSIIGTLVFGIILAWLAGTQFIPHAVVMDELQPFESIRASIRYSTNNWRLWLSMTVLRVLVPIGMILLPIIAIAPLQYMYPEEIITGIAVIVSVISVGYSISFFYSYPLIFYRNYMDTVGRLESYVDD